MENIKTTTTVKQITTVTAVHISFDHEGSTHTAEFEHTEHKDASGKRISYECSILNQIALPAMSDEEDNTLWSLAETVPCQPEVKNAANLPKLLQGIDWPLLNQQRLRLAEILAENDLPASQTDALDGVLEFLDALVEGAVNDDVVPESVMFPEEPAPADSFLHAELQADYNNAEFRSFYPYQLKVSKNATGPDSYALSIYDPLDTVDYEFSYDAESEANQDMITFKSLLNA